MPKVIIQYQGQEWSVELKEGPNVIGRSSKCTIPVRDINMSREHCEIHLAGGVATLFDKGSMNGTLLNGVKVLERRLAPGDKIQIGSSAIFFEEKKPGDPGPAVAPPPPAGRADNLDDTTKPKTETSRSVQKKTEGRRSVSLLLKDYSAWGRDGGSRVGAVVAVAAVAVVAAVAFVAARALGGGPAEPGDVDNLLGANGSFESAGDRGPAGWQLKPGLKSRIGLDQATAHRGKSSLVIDKSPDAGDLVVECAYAEDFALGDARRVHFSAWTKSDAFGGYVLLKIAWTTNVRGAVLLEECSEPLAKPQDWKQISREFVPPPGAGAYSVALCAIGRSGRVFFDDARVTQKPGPESPRETTLGGFGVSVGPSGAFQASTQNRRVLSNVHLALASEKEGVSPQTIVTSAAVKPEEKRIQIEGKILSPIDLREIDFQQQIILDESDVVVAWSLPADALKQIEKLHVLATVPRPERVSGLPGPNDSGTVKVHTRTEGVDVVLEYLDPTKVTGSRERGGQKLLHVFPVERTAGKVTVGFKIRPGTSGLLEAAADNPLRAAETEIGKRENFSGALAILKRYVGGIREPEKRKSVLAEIARLDELERRDWNEVQAACFKAWISRRGELFDGALQRLATYQRQWGGEPYAAKSQPLREDVEKQAVESAGERDAERARRLLERVKVYAQAGKRTLAREVCELLLTPRFADTDAAREAAEILKALQSP